MTFCVCIGHERQKPFLGIIIFIRRVPPSNFVVVTFLLTSLRKGYFLRRRLKRYRVLMAKFALLIVFFIYIRLQASPNFNAESFCVWWMGIILTVLCWRSLPKRHQWKYQRHFESISGRRWINAMLNCYCNCYLIGMQAGPEFDPPVRHILSWRLGHENISTAILPLPLIQEEQLSVTGERMCTKYW